MQNNLSKKIIIWPNEIFWSVDRTHVYKIDDDQLMHTEDGTNLYCIRFRVANTNGYCQKTNDSCHDTTQ